MSGIRNRQTILEVAFTALICSSLEQVCPFTTTDYSTTSSSGSECFPNLKNMAVYEGDENIIMSLTADPNNVKWTIKSTSNELDTFTISNYGGYRDPTLTGLFYPNESGLVILNATIVPNGEGLISTSGLYIAQCENDDTRTRAKLIVVRSGPECSCNPDLNTSDVSCNIVFADSTFNPIFPIVTWKINGTYLATYTLQRTKIDDYVFFSQSTITVDASSPDYYECEMSFAAPTDIQLLFIASNSPEFSESCSTEGTATCITKASTPSKPNLNASGGLSDGGKIGVGVGIGIGGPLILVGILFAVLCRRHEWINRTKTGNESINGKLDMGTKGRDNRNVPQYEHIKVLSAKNSNAGPVYDQLTTSANVDVAQRISSEGAIYENVERNVNADEPCVTGSNSLQQNERQPSVVYETIDQLRQ